MPQLVNQGLPETALTRAGITTIALVLACAVWALMLIWWFREYVDALLRRLPGETWLAALIRGGRERALNQKARAQMLGGRVTTSLLSIACVVLTGFTSLWAVEGQWYGYALGGFVLVGFAATTRLRLKFHPSWQRLNVADRLIVRFTHAWLWPLHFASRATSRDDIRQ